MNEREFRQEAVKRAPLLDVLCEQPRTMRQLDERLPTSRSTIHRALGTFEEANVVRKVEQTYHLTGFGEIVAEQTREFTAELETARALDEFLNAISEVDVDVPLACFRDADITQPQPREAHTGVKRIIDLIEASDSLRMFSNVLSPLYVDVARQQMVQGMELEVIFDERLVDLILSEYADQALDAFRTGRFEVYVGSDVPFELFLHEDRMAMAAHNDAAFPRMFVETKSAAAVEWAEELYRSYRESAHRFDSGALGQVLEASPPQAIED